MFRDTKKELARLEAELLAEELPEVYLPDEDWEDEPEEADEDLTQPPRYRAYNTDISDEDLDEYAEEVLSAGKRRLSGFLIFLLCLLTLGLVALVVLFLQQEGLL